MSPYGIFGPSFAIFKIEKPGQLQDVYLTGERNAIVPFTRLQVARGRAGPCRVVPCDTPFSQVTALSVP